MPATLEQETVRELTPGFYVVNGTSMILSPKTKKTLVPGRAFYLSNEDLQEPVIRSFANDRDARNRYILEPVSRQEAQKINIAYDKRMAELAGRVPDVSTADNIKRAAKEGRIGENIQRRYFERLSNWDEQKIYKWVNRLASNSNLAIETRLNRLSFILESERNGRNREDIIAVIVGAMAKVTNN